MNDLKRMTFVIAGAGFLLLAGCNSNSQPRVEALQATPSDTPVYFLLRPEVEKQYGYTHAVKIGTEIKISGAVSMDEKGNLTAPGSMEQQLMNCYSDLQKILQHYGCTFDDVVVENVFTTDMARFIEASSFRRSVYKKQSPPVPGWK